MSSPTTVAKTDAEFSNRLYLLGPPQVVWKGETIANAITQKALALLGYQALHEQPVVRTELAGLFWGERTEAQARNNLRVALHRLSATLPGALQVARSSVQLRRTTETDSVWVDALAFDTMLEQGDAAPVALAEAVALGRGRFMEGIFLNDCPEYEAWLAAEQSRRHIQVVQALYELTRHHTHVGEYTQQAGTTPRACHSWNPGTSLPIA